MMKRRTTSFQIRSSHHHKWKRRLFFAILLCLCIGSFVLLEIYRSTINLLMPFPNFFAQKPKIAFLFIARNRLPLDFVWDSFFRGDKDKSFSVFVHSRPGFLFNKATTKSLYFLNRQVNDSIQVDWGEASMIQAERILLKSALVDPANERFIFLSDSYLIFFSAVYHYTTLVIRMIISCQHLPVLLTVLLTQRMDVTIQRCNLLFLLQIGVKSLSFADTKDGRYNPKMQPVIPVTNWRKGSQWVILHRKHAEIIVKDETVFPVFQQHCKRKSLPEFWRHQPFPVDTSKEHNCIPDEHYVQTLLALEGLEGEITRRSLIHTAWDLPASKDHERRGWHPVTYKFSDATPELILSIKEIDNIYYETENRREWCSNKGKPSLASSLQESLLGLQPFVCLIWLAKTIAQY